MKTVIEMAREAGATPYTNRHYPDRPTHTFTVDQLERFAAFVAAAERNRTWTQDHWTEYERSIVAAEREACAKVLDEMAEDMEREMEPSTAIAYVRSKAATIRARGETK